jgi:DNA modification methylase
MTTTILQGDCRDVLPTLPPASVQCVVTSPPYYGLRNYGVDGQIGLEDSPDAYVDALVAVFREVRRVLRDDGTVWLNLGDSYGRGTRPLWAGDSRRGASDREAWKEYPQRGVILPEKNLLGIPWRAAFALQADGWILRCDIVWHKPNPMPESVTDRPTRAHEYLFLFSKSERYSYDADAIREPHAEPWRSTGKVEQNHFSVGDGNRGSKAMPRIYNPEGRNRRSVWTIATQSFDGAHFATFPEKLVEPCILAGSSPRACEVCSAPWARVIEPTGHINGREPAHVPGRSATKTDSTGWAPTTRATDTWRPTCTHENAGAGRCVVLDSFAGSGTTLRVAERLGRDSIGIELNPEYIKLQERRTDGVQLVSTELWT